MTDTDEHLLTAAKLHEQVRGDLDGGVDLHDHAGLISDSQDHAVLNFLNGSMDFGTSELGRAVSKSLVSNSATDALMNGNANVLSSLVGVTEGPTGDKLLLATRLLEKLDNNGATAFVLGAGNPNTGKTNAMSLLVELSSHVIDDLLVVSNIREWDGTDIHVAGAHDLAVTLIEHRETPKWVVVDEGSTHFDARTYRHEVATQWTPLAKRFAKIGVEACGIIGHSGKDLHPETKRLASLCFFKNTKDTAEFYERWPADADHPVGRFFGGTVRDLEPTSLDYNPDDAAPWAWDLRSGIFSEDVDWSELLEMLQDEGLDQEQGH